MKEYSMGEIVNTISCLRVFKQAYKEKDGVVTIGDIRDLISKIDLIECCLKKQKHIPTHEEKKFKLFGELEFIPYCMTCGKRLYPEQGEFCPQCGQRFC